MHRGAQLQVTECPQLLCKIVGIGYNWRDSFSFQCLCILGTGFISRAIAQTSLTVVFHLQQHKRAETRDMLYQLK